MKQFTHTITDPLGIHARPAGQIARLAREFPDTRITIARGSEEVKAAQLMKLMGLGAKQGDAITLRCEGAQEDRAIETIGSFIREKL